MTVYSRSIVVNQEVCAFDIAVNESIDVQIVKALDSLI